MYVYIYIYIQIFRYSDMLQYNREEKLGMFNTKVFFLPSISALRAIAITSIHAEHIKHLYTPFHFLSFHFSSFHFFCYTTCVFLY